MISQHTGSNANNNTFKFKRTQQCKRTDCLSNTAPVPYIQPTNINSESSLPLQCIWTTKQRMSVRLRPHTALNTNNTFKFKHTHTHTHVLSVRSGSTRHPSHIFNQRRSTQSRHRGVFAQHMMRVRVRLRPHTASTTNKTFKFKRTRTQTYPLFAQDQRNATPFHTFI